MDSVVMKRAQEPVWYKIQRWYVWTKRVIGILIFTTLGWSFLELVGPGRVIEEAFMAEIRATFPLNLFIKEDPAKIEEEARRRAIEEVQAQCPHLWRHNNLWNHFCPLCGKKILPGDYPLWQV